MVSSRQSRSNAGRFQLSGKAFDNKLNYVAGLYYFEEAGYVHDFVPFEGLLYVYDFQNDVNNIEDEVNQEVQTIEKDVQSEINSVEGK